MDTDLNSAISAFLTNCDEHQLFQLTRFYMERLEQAIEEGVEGVGFMLTHDHHFNEREYHSVTDLAEKGKRAGASKLLLDLVMEKGSGARRVMWESFVKLHHHLPKLSRILKEIRERGDGQFAYMDTERSLSEVPAHLKDVRRKHMETLRAKTETLRVNTILMREKVKVFQLVDRYAELTVISTVRDRTLVEHELLARGRDHELWREKDLRGKLEKIRTDQLFKESFVQKLKRSVFGNKSGMSAAVNRGLAQVSLGSVETLAFSGMTLTPIDCAVLSHVIGLCDTIKHLNLENCRIHCEGIQRLGPGLHKCQELSLGWNELGDSEVKLVSAALRNPECKIQKLGLWGVGLTDSGAEDLASALSTNPSLMELDLSANKLGDSGVKLVSAALRNPECKIQKLGLRDVGLTDSGAEDLISALRTNPSLRELSLGWNSLTDRWVPALRRLILALPSLQRIELLGNQFRETGRNELRSLQEPRPGLTVHL
ncbi:ribonuclease inhibitor-like [Hemitrygon akajei]|uniref:ribonuclease inhibitor-like n=1 Tax=Hemitrygon akajei TaxID=2704970 RepID=UPI003BF9E1D6